MCLPLRWYSNTIDVGEQTPVLALFNSIMFPHTKRFDYRCAQCTTWYNHYIKWYAVSFKNLFTFRDDFAVFRSWMYIEIFHVLASSTNLLQSGIHRFPLSIFSIPSLPSLIWITVRSSFQFSNRIFDLCKTKKSWGEGIISRQRYYININSCSLLLF